MIYRILHDDHYLTFEIPTREVLNKLGRANPFHIDRTPKPYASLWHEPLNILFRPPEKDSQNIVPNLAEVDGKLFLDETAYGVLKDILKGDVECLPVRYEGGTGYILNILAIAEDMDGLDEKLTGYDQHGNLGNFGFVSEIMGIVPLFRAAIDGYQGIFCSEKVANLVVENGLKGVIFRKDLANPIGESFDERH